MIEKCFEIITIINTNLNKIFVSAAAFYTVLKYLLKTQHVPYTTPMNADMFTSALAINALQLTNSSIVAHVHARQ